MSIQSFFSREASTTQSQNPLERFTLSENYFERVNTEYRIALLSGNRNQNTIRNIRTRNRVRWDDWLGDFMESPKAGAMWLATRAIEGVTGIFSRIWNSRISQNLFNNRFARTFRNWISETVGITNPIDTIRNHIFGNLSSPFHKSRELVSQLNSIPGLQNFDFSSEAALSGSTRILTQLGRRGEIARDMVILNAFLERNPIISANASESDLTSESYWTMVLDRAQITQNRQDLIAIYTGTRTLQEVMQNPESETTEEDNDDEEGQSNNADESSESDETIREGFIPLSEFVERRMSEFQNTFNQVQNSINQTRNDDSSLFYTLVVSLTYFTRGHLLQLISSGGSVGTSAINTLVQLSKSTFQFGRQNPVSLGIISAGMVGLIIAMKDKPADILVPENPEAFKAWLQEELANNQEWLQFLATLPEETRNNVDTMLEYASGLREIPEIPTDQINDFVSSILETFMEHLGLNDTEIITMQNRKGINSMMSYRIREYFEGEELADLFEILNSFMFEFSINNGVSIEMLEQLEIELADFNIVLTREDNGIIYWQVLLDEVTQEYSAPVALLINPSLSRSEQAQAARRFTIERHYAIGVVDLISIDARRRLNIFNDPIENPEGWMDEFKNFIRNEDGVFAIIGGELVLMPLEGAIVRLTGPVRVYYQLIRAALTDSTLEVEAHDLLVQYANGVIPLLAYGTTRSFYSRFVGPTKRFNFLRNTVMHGLGGPIILTVQIPAQLSLALLSKRYRVRYAKQLTYGQTYSARILERFLNQSTINNIRVADTLYEIQRTTKARLGIRAIVLPSGSHMDTDFIRRIDELISNISHIDSNLADQLRATNFARSPQNLQQLHDLAENQANQRAPQLRRTPTATPPTTSPTRTNQLNNATGNNPTNPRNAPQLPRGGGRRWIKPGLFTLAGGGITAGFYRLFGGRGNSTELNTTNLSQNSRNNNTTIETIETSDEEPRPEPHLSESGFQLLEELNPTILHLQQRYEWLNEFSQYQNLISISDDSIVGEASAIAAHHIQTVNQAKEFIRNNQSQIHQLLQELKSMNSEQRLVIATDILEIDLDNNNRIVLNYTKERSLRNTLYENVDLARLMHSFPNLLGGGTNLQETFEAETNRIITEINQVESSQNLSEEEKDQQRTELEDELINLNERYQIAQTELIARITTSQIAMDVTPVVGNIRDLRRVNREIGRGRFARGAMDSVSFAAGSIADLVTFGKGGAALRAAFTGTRIATKMQTLITRSRRFTQVLTTRRNFKPIDTVIRHRNKIIWGAIGADITIAVGRGLLVPGSMNGTYRF